jgi:deoxyribonuclease-4
MRIGFHISIAGKLAKVMERARERKCETMQIFSRNPRRWGFKELVRDEVEQFRKELRNSGISPLVVHLPYLPNLASENDELYKKSVESLQEDLKRAGLLGAAYLVFHPGRRGELSKEEAFHRVTEGIHQSLDTVNNGVVLLVENTAGQGSEICCTFSELAEIVKQSGEKHRLGVCFDTAHAYAAGYDISNKRGVEKVIREFERLIGLERLHLIHLNDSRTPFNSRVDRHENIGKGFIGLAGFSALLHHPSLSHRAAIMETPWKGLNNDLRNMRVVRRILQEKGKGQ